MLARECSLEDCSMQQDPRLKRPLIRALSGLSVRRNVQGIALPWRLCTSIYISYCYYCY